MKKILFLLLLLCGQTFCQEGEVQRFGWVEPKSPPVLNEITQVWQDQLKSLVQYNDENDALTYRYLYKVYKDNNLLTQLEKDTGRLASLDQEQVGSCVGWGTTRALQVTAACDIEVRNEREIYKIYFNPAGIYAIGRADHLGGWDGSTGAWSVEGIKKYGTLHRQKYGDIDITNATPYDGRKWAASGLPKDLLSAAGEHKVIASALVSTPAEVQAALQNGYGVILCSNVGYNSTRDQMGFARRQGSWAHCMACIAYRGEKSGKEGYLVSNSWGGPEGKWINGPIWPEDMPFGSFWVTPEDLSAHLRAQDSYAIAGYEGFKKRDLKWNEVFDVGEDIED